MSRNQLTAVVLVITAVFMAGCAASPTPASTSATPLRTASPTASAETTSAQPVLAFGGECDNVVTDEQLTAVLGPEAGPRAEGGLDLFWLPSAETGGGLRCAWNANATEEDRIPGADYVWADVLASDVVPAATKEHYSTARCEGVYDGTVCHLGVESGGAWTLVSTGLLEYDAEIAPEVLTELASIVPANARGYVPPVASHRSEAWWARPDCEAVGLSIGLDEFFSNPTAGNWEGGPGAFDRILSDVDLQVACPWFSEYLNEGDIWGELTVTVAPGSGWMWPEMRRVGQSEAAGGPPVVSTEVKVVGASAARMLSYGEGQQMAIATDGTNVVRVTVTRGDPIMATERVLASLAESR